ncbi:FemAB family XrtA/PEP-CTERM system-associated protein [Novosphingobium sp.]|uniref:FemAB family XrtA/PEP-CTERM system-associated protein n=1 Tax=Novosphingobium sp. TaxID=1874826 RepID=UPI001EB9F525|nr:FemAB family XrtA/PEP-CTERM system-associated protein [Novosphingobium sp.]MBK6801051.1 FemAB family PEP-CTERM system-associated protein [Novosphingobium sp.]MBK9011608.1 FemAB family PEP-CTERM system-associated protein [Novosphingobium sp.]
MNAPFRPSLAAVRATSLAEVDEVRRIEAFVAGHPDATPFHRPAWLLAAARGTGNRARAVLLERGWELTGYLPLLEVHSPLFGGMLASSGFGVGGGILLAGGEDAGPLFAALEELALRLSCPAAELRGGPLPEGRAGWKVRFDSHCGFVTPLAADDEAQLLAIPRKQRAEVRKGLGTDLTVEIGRGEADRADHYAVYAESVRNLGTPVFPRRLFAEVLDAFGEDADILTVRHKGAPVASVLSLYHRGAVMPYWGGGTMGARRLRANDRMYFELMLHARRRGCLAFDFGRSKTGSGAYEFKRNWGFDPQPLGYASWTAPGQPARDADPTSNRHAARIALWKRLPLAVANLAGPIISRGLA